MKRYYIICIMYSNMYYIEICRNSHRSGIFLVFFNHFFLNIFQAIMTAATTETAAKTTFASWTTSDTSQTDSDHDGHWPRAIFEYDQQTQAKIFNERTISQILRRRSNSNSASQQPHQHQQHQQTTDTPTTPTTALTTPSTSTPITSITWSPRHHNQ